MHFTKFFTRKHTRRSLRLSSRRLRTAVQNVKTPSTSTPSRKGGLFSMQRETLTGLLAITTVTVQYLFTTPALSSAHHTSLQTPPPPPTRPFVPCTPSSTSPIDAGNGSPILLYMSVACVMAGIVLGAGTIYTRGKRRSARINRPPPNPTPPDPPPPPPPPVAQDNGAGDETDNEADNEDSGDPDPDPDSDPPSPGSEAEDPPPPPPPFEFRPDLSLAILYTVLLLRLLYTSLSPHLRANPRLAELQGLLRQLLDLLNEVEVTGHTMDMRDYAWGAPFVVHGMEDLPELAASSVPAAPMCPHQPLNLPQPLADAIRAYFPEAGDRAVRGRTWRRRASGYISALGDAVRAFVPERGVWSDAREAVAAVRMRLVALGAWVPIEWGTVLRAVMGLVALGVVMKRVVDVPLRVSAPTGVLPEIVEANVDEEEEGEEETPEQDDGSDGSRTVSVEDLGEADAGPSVLMSTILSPILEEDEEEDSSSSDPLLPPFDPSIACTSSASFTTALSLSFISSPARPLPPSTSTSTSHDAFSFRPDASSSRIHPQMVFAPDEDGVWLPREVRAGEEMDMDSRGWLGIDQNQKDLRVSEEEWAEFVAMFPEVLEQPQAPARGGEDEMSEYLPPLDVDEVGEGLSWDDEGVRGGEEVEAGLASFISGADAEHHTEEDVHELRWEPEDIQDGDAIEAGLEDYSLIIDDTPLGRPIPFIIDESTPDTPDAEQESEDQDLGGAILAGPYLGELARMMEEEMRAVEEVQMRGAMRVRVEETGRQWAAFTSRGGGRGALKGKGKGKERVEPAVDLVRGALPKPPVSGPSKVKRAATSSRATTTSAGSVSDAATTEATRQGKGKGKGKGKERVKPEVDRVRGALPKPPVSGPRKVNRRAATSSSSSRAAATSVVAAVPVIVVTAPPSLPSLPSLPFLPPVPKPTPTPTSTPTPTPAPTPTSTQDLRTMDGRPERQSAPGEPGL
ncbi:hypothetical protein FPV67DRAFT_1449196 [Lyophyllum atratum]|nr:hypothetical protein FPV67DRAFT_1449196 [Lyophyllum atratum]